MVDIEISLLNQPTTTTYIPLRITTGYEDFEIVITTRIENGTLALIPQVVRL